MRPSLWSRLSSRILLLVLGGIMGFAILFHASSRQISSMPTLTLETARRTPYQNLGVHSAEKDVPEQPIRAGYFKVSERKGDVDRRSIASRKRVPRLSKLLKLSEVKLKPILVNELSEKLRSIKSNKDFVRLFLDHDLSDQQIFTWANLYAVNSSKGPEAQVKPQMRFKRTVTKGSSRKGVDISHFDGPKDLTTTNVIRSETHNTEAANADGENTESILSKITQSLLILGNEIQPTTASEIIAMSSTPVPKRVLATSNFADTQIGSRVAASESEPGLFSSSTQSTPMLNIQNDFAPLTKEFSTLSQQNVASRISTIFPYMAADKLDSDSEKETEILNSVSVRTTRTLNSEPVKTISFLNSNTNKVKGSLNIYSDKTTNSLTIVGSEERQSSLSQQPDATLLMSTAILSTVNDSLNETRSSTNTSRGSITIVHSSPEKITRKLSGLPEQTVSLAQDIYTTTEALHIQKGTPTKAQFLDPATHDYFNASKHVNSTLQQVTIDARNVTKTLTAE
ncbi:hypothetical protein EGW08_022018, partial [Elysia chlorotica]